MLRRIQDIGVGVLSRSPISARLRIQPGMAGFFGEVFITLNGLRFAEMNRLKVSIYWGPKSPYFEAEKSPNAWSSFFQVSDFDFSTGRNRLHLNVPYRPGAQDFLPYQGLSVRQSVSRALRNWCQPRTEIMQDVQSFIATQFQKRKMLGVHVRLTDVAAGAEGRRTVALDQITDAIDNWLAETPEGGIYLATDEQRVINQFSARYLGRLVFQDCLRSLDGTSIHGHYDAGVAGSPYFKGREVLTDALLLANCHHLVRTHSRVTAFSLCWNPGLSYIDLERVLLGIDRTPWLHAPH